MDELVAKVAAATGIDPGTARKAVIVILQFLSNAAPPDRVGPLIAAIPGAEEAVRADGPGPSDLMGAFGALTAAGLDMGGVQGVATAFGRIARETVGPEAVDQVVAGVPGLSQFV